MTTKDKAVGVLLPSGIRIASNSLWGLGGWVATTLLGFLAVPILVRQLGKDVYGLMALLNAIVAPIALLDFGLGDATIKYMAESFGRKEHDEAEKYLQSTLFFNVALGVLGALVIAFFADALATSVFNIPPEHQALARRCLYMVGLTWALTQVRRTYMGALTALQEYRALSIGTFCMQAGTWGAAVAVVLMGGNLFGVLFGQMVVAGLSSVGWLLVARYYLPGFAMTPVIHRETFRRSLGFGVWRMVDNLGGLAAHQSQAWLLGILAPVATVGYFNLAVQAVNLVYMVVYRVGQVMFPAISQMHGQGQVERAAWRSLQASWFCCTLGAAGLVAVACFAREFLALWVGAEIASQAAPVMRVVALGIAVTTAFAVPSFYLLGTGKTRWLAAMSWLQGSIVLTLAILLVPRLGVVGAAWAGTGSVVVHICMLLLMWRRDFRAWIPLRTYLAASFGPAAVGLAFGGVVFWAKSSVSWSLNWAELAVAGSVCAGLTWAVLLGVDGFLPGGAERRRRLLELILGFRAHVWPSQRCPTGGL